MVTAPQEPPKPQPPTLVGSMPIDPRKIGINIPNPDTDNSQARSLLQNEINGAQVTLDQYEDNLNKVTIELQACTFGSNIDAFKFREALESGQSLDEVGIKYFGIFDVTKKSRAGKADPSQKKRVEDLYWNGQTIVGNKQQANSTRKKNAEIIRSHYSTTQEFNNILLDGLPYELVIRGENVDRRALKSISSDYKIMNFHALNELVINVGQWASGQDHIELNMRDPAYKAQHYLVKLAQDMPMTLKPVEANQLETCELRLQPAKEGRKVELVALDQESGKQPMIVATRIMTLVDTTDKELGRYRWNETINVATGEVTRDVTEIKN